MYRELPISEERLAELREPLADETNMVLDLFLSKLDGTEKDEEELHEIGALAHNLPEEERAKLHDVNVEIMKAYDRRLKREEAIIVSRGFGRFGRLCRAGYFPHPLTAQ